MKFKFPVLLFTLCAISGRLPAADLRISLNDTFHVDDTRQWRVQVVRVLTLRFAEVDVAPYVGDSFRLKLWFRCDTPDLAKLDTEQKRKQAVIDMVKPYMSRTVEREVVVEEYTVKSQKAYRTWITDASLVGKSLKPGEFKYLYKGVVRLSKDSALGFSLLTNDKESDDVKAVTKYIESFAK